MEFEMVSANDPEELLELAKKATQGEWFYETERYSARCLIGQKPLGEDRWIAHFQPEFNGENNAQYAATACPHNLIPLLERYIELEKLAEKMADYLGLLNTGTNMGMPRTSGYLCKEWQKFKESVK